MARTIKVYKCELDGRYGNGVAVVAHYNQRYARKMAKSCIKQHRLEGELDSQRLLVTELPDLTYNKPEPAVILWSHYVQ